MFSASLAVTQEDGGTWAQQTDPLGLKYYSVLEFMLYVKPKSGPGGEKYELPATVGKLRRNDGNRRGDTNCEIQRTKGVPAAPGTLPRGRITDGNSVRHLLQEGNCREV